MLEILNTIKYNIESNLEILTVSLFVILVCNVIKSKRNKKLKIKKSKKNKPGFYNTGYKCSFSLKDVIKLKLRFSDYCDKQGVRFSYLIAIKIFNFEISRMKYTDQNGKVSKRKIRFGR